MRSVITCEVWEWPVDYLFCRYMERRIDLLHVIILPRRRLAAVQQESPIQPIPSMDHQGGAAIERTVMPRID
jgi:hypothetical protein